jgi:DNA-binding transcriptional regulator YiaG
MYHYTESGLRNVWLVNGYRQEVTPYGKGVAVENVEGLHKAIGLSLAKERPSLTGMEFRFLRKELGLSQARLAQWWGYDAQSVANWEKRGRVPKIADRFIRVFYLEKVSGNPSVVEIVERLSDMDRQEKQRLTFKETSKGWKLAA